jgi:hypothetical protein
MKTFFLTLAALSLALIIGCQESMLNEPSETILKQKDDFVNTNNLSMKYELQDPLYGTSTLTGQVTYIHQVIYQPMGPIGFNRISININLNAELHNLLGISPRKWIIQGRSEDVVTVSEEGILIIEKYYSINNRRDVVLLVQYLVTTDGIGISGVSLAPSKI